MNITDRIENFLEEEKERRPNKEYNLVLIAFRQIQRYYNFLRIINERYKKVDEEFIISLRTLQESCPPDTHSLSEHLQMILKENERLTSILHLEIESFYLFTKILLDKIARVMKFYSGKVKRISLNSHYELSKNIQSYRSTKGLSPLPAELNQLMNGLQKDICHYRDKEIVHAESHRAAKGTISRATGTSRIASFKNYPRDEDQQIESKAPSEIMTQIDEYIEGIINYISLNKERASAWDYVPGPKKWLKLG